MLGGAAADLQSGSVPLLPQARHFLLQMLELTGLLFQLLLPCIHGWLLHAAANIVCLCMGPAAFERESLPSEQLMPQIGQLCLHPPVHWPWQLTLIRCRKR